MIIQLIILQLVSFISDKLVFGLVTSAGSHEHDTALVEADTDSDSLVIEELSLYENTLFAVQFSLPKKRNKLFHLFKSDKVSKGIVNVLSGYFSAKAINEAVFALTIAVLFLFFLQKADWT
jgi:hypothetical protein